MSTIKIKPNQILSPSTTSTAGIVYSDTAELKTITNTTGYLYNNGSGSLSYITEITSDEIKYDTDGNYLGDGVIQTYDKRYLDYETFFTYSGEITEALIDGYGSVVKISANGNVMVVGCPTYNSNIGIVKIYKKTEPYLPNAPFTFVHNLQALVPTAGDYFGKTIELSADGSTLVIGSPPYNSSQGTVSIYERVGDVWNYEATFDGVGQEEFGYALALSADGNCLFVTARSYNTFTGRVKNYIKPADTWIYNTTFTGAATFRYFGKALSISNIYPITPSTFKRLLAITDVTGVHIYTQNNSDIWSFSHTVVSPDPIGGEGFGEAISLSNDGRYLAVGCPYANTNNGRVQIFTMPMGAGSFTHKQTLLPFTSSGNMGITLDFSLNGDILVVGNPNASSDTIKIYKKFESSDNDYFQWDSITLSGYTPTQYDGVYVSVTNDGDMIIFGDLQNRHMVVCERNRKSLKNLNGIKSNNGYQELPGGLILQWGNLSNQNFNQSNIVVDFNVPFKHALFFATMQISYATSINGSIGSVFVTGNLTSATFMGDNSTDATTGTAYWFAIGY